MPLLERWKEVERFEVEGFKEGDSAVHEGAGEQARRNALGEPVSEAFFSRLLRFAGAAVRNSAGRPIYPRGDGWSRLERRPDRGGPPARSSTSATPSATSLEPGAFLCARAGCEELVAAAAELPCYEGRPVCGARCLGMLVDAAIHRAMAQPQLLLERYQHRMPLGLLMLSRRFITEQQLAVALARQRHAGYGRLGEWLVESGAADEAQVARALAAQWGIPWLQSGQPGPAALALLPRLLLEAFTVVPMRLAAKRILYLAIDHKVDPCLNLAIEKMTGLSVEPVAMSGRSFRLAQQQLLAQEHPRARLFGASSPGALRDSVLAVAAETGAGNLRLARVHEYFWLRVEGRNRPTRVEDAMFACAFIKPLPESAGAAGIASHLEN